MNEQQNQVQQNQTQQTNLQANQQMAQQVKKASEPKTIVNGQEVTIIEAQAIEEEALMQNTQTGIQQQHDNSSEAVCAGQIAQNSDQLMQQYQQHSAVRPSELQSGQQHLAQHVQQAQQAVQQIEQQMQQEEQQRNQKAQQEQQKLQQKTQGLPEQQKVKVEDHSVIQNDLDAKAKAKAKKSEQ